MVEITTGHFLQKYELQDNELFAGFSGGADSTALLLALHLNGAKVTAVHFNHGIRGNEADADQEWCREFCEKRSIPFITKQLHVPANMKRGESLEEAARRMRMESWTELAAKGQPVFLAHHCDDAMEDLFLRLARGSNASALVPMKEKRAISGINFMRPLLRIRRREIESWLLSKGIEDWRTDSTNKDNSCRRNALRNRLLPLFREIFGEDQGLIHAMDAIRQDAEYLDAQAEEHCKHLDSIQAWKELPQAMLARAVKLMFLKNKCTEQPTRQFILHLREALEAFNGREITVQLDRENSVLVTSGGVIFKRSLPQWEPFTWNWQQTPSVPIPDTDKFLKASTNRPDSSIYEAFSRNSLPDTLTIRRWRQGDRMIPFGSASPRKLQDLFTNSKIPRSNRDSFPLIEADSQIIWIPELRRAEFGRLSEDDKVIYLSLLSSKDVQE